MHGAEEFRERNGLVRRPAKLVQFLLALLLCNLLSCSREEGRAGGGAQEQPTVRPYPSAAPLVDLEGLKKELRSLKGKVVLVDFWATYCVPCVKGLPRVAALKKRFGGQGFEVLLVNRDLPDDWPKALKTLKERASGLKCVVLEDASRDAAIEYFGTNWRGELPARFLIDRSGGIVGEFLAESTDEDIAQAVSSLLKESSASGGKGRQK